MATKMKYADVIRDIEEQFANENWSILSKVKAYPSNYQGPNNENEFVKIEFVPAQPVNNYGQFGVAGQVIIQIYTEAGIGLTRTSDVAHDLDVLIENKRFSRGTITGTSSLSFLGIDNDDNSLFRADYSIGFRNYQ